MNTWMFGPTRTHGEGLAPIGLLGEFRAACPTLLTVNIDCIEGCAPDAETRIEDALNLIVRDETCVGSRVCIEHLHAAVLNVLGRDNCPRGIEFVFDDTLLYRDGSFAYLDCGRYLKVEAVNI